MNICYVHLGNNNSADRVVIRGLRENGVTVSEVSDNSRGFKKFGVVRKVFNRAESDSSSDSIIVGYTAALFVPWMRLLSKKPITYYALASFYESMILSRKVGWRFSLAAFKYWTIDWLAFRSANLILVESQAQKEFIQRSFKIRADKLLVHRTGVDDSVFRYDPTVKKQSKFTVLFRGKFTHEAGVDVLLSAAKKLQDLGRSEIQFRILGHGLLENEIKNRVAELELKNVELVTEYLSNDDLRKKMLECHIFLGQLSDHPRLNNTIPFKAYESMSMKFPFITARNKAVLEIFTENENCICFKPGDAENLAQKILFAYENPTLLEKLAANSYGLFSAKLTPRILTAQLLEMLPK